MTAEEILQKYSPKPSTYKDKLKRLGAGPSVVAQYLNQTYHHTLHQLNGRVRIPPATEKKIRLLINELESER